MKAGTDAMKRFEEIKNEFNGGKYKNTVGYNAIADLIQMVYLLIKRSGNDILCEIESLKYKNEGLCRQVDNYRYFPERIKDEIYKLEDFINTFKFIGNTECYAYKVAMEKLNLLKQIYYKC